MLFRAATYNGLSQGLDLFCQRYKLAENIKVLLEEEPRDQLHTAVRRSAMFAMAEMSFVEAVLEGKEIGLLRTCFSSIFLLPPKEEMQDLKPFLYFTMLLTFTTSERASVRERAVGRMRVLSFLLANYSSLKVTTRHTPLCQEPALPQSCFGWGCPRSLEGAQAWQLSPHGAVRQDGFRRAMQTSDPPGSSPGHTHGFRALAPGALKPSALPHPSPRPIPMRTDTPPVQGCKCQSLDSCWDISCYSSHSRKKRPAAWLWTLFVSSSNSSISNAGRH
ncbi:uncharacterized protein [Patagioenas fasciata]|uniref:uncharacterized protein isoform X2 n=1 Tax=Patagioenas fasciata TaxID=372321 RepID=UPI003A98F4DD